MAVYMFALHFLLAKIYFYLNTSKWHENIDQLDHTWIVFSIWTVRWQWTNEINIWNIFWINVSKDATRKLKSQGRRLFAPMSCVCWCHLPTHMNNSTSQRHTILFGHLFLSTAANVHLWTDCKIINWNGPEIYNIRWFKYKIYAYSSCSMWLTLANMTFNEKRYAIKFNWMGAVTRISCQVVWLMYTLKMMDFGPIV